MNTYSYTHLFVCNHVCVCVFKKKHLDKATEDRYKN